MEVITELHASADLSMVPTASPYMEALIEPWPGWIFLDREGIFAFAGSRTELR
jgi:hypothetical protein